MLPGSELTEQDLQSLRARWISADVAKSARLRRITDAEGRELFGGGKRAARSGVLIPYFEPAQTLKVKPRGYRVRRDNPELERKPDGTTKVLRKYLAPSGSANMLYFHPDADPADLQNAQMPLVITEGEFKALALYGLSWHGVPDSGLVPNWLSVALSGVFNFRGTIGTEERDGKIVKIMGPLLDWGWLSLAGRRVVIIFDCDVAKSLEIQRARLALASWLVEQKANVFIAEVPVQDDKPHVKGVDDWLADAGPDPVLRALADAKPLAQPAKKEKTSKPDGVSLYDDIRLFRTRNREAYAMVKVGARQELMRVDSHDFENYVVRRLIERDNGVPSDEIINKTTRYCRAMATTKPAVSRVFVRVGSDDPAARVVLDLANEDWQVVEITAAGWQVKNESSVLFERPGSLQPLPIPERGGSWDLLHPLVNSQDEDNFVLMVAWLVGALAPAGPYPILMISGEKGSGKSSTAENIRKILDPVESARRTLPESERDLMVEAMSTWVVAYDNLSGVTRKQSDMLCRLSTGGGSAQRKLHSNNEQIVLAACRPQVLNGIVDLGTYPDLLSRGLAVELPILRKASGERDIERQFHAAWPKLLGLVCDAASAALRCLPQVNIEKLPRMADFTRWVYAAALGNALPFDGSRFLLTYEENRKLAFVDTMEAAPFPRAVQRLMEAIPVFEGTAEDLRVELNRKFGTEVSRYGWATSTQKLSNELKDMASVIRESGIVVERFRQSRHLNPHRPKMIRLARSDDFYYAGAHQGELSPVATV